MPVNSKHQHYTQMAPIWRDCRDAIQGERAVKESGTAHLSMLGAQSDAEYESYKKRALFYGASGRTLQGLTGLMFRKDPSVNWPKALEDWSENATVRNTDFNELARSVCENVIAVGRHGVLLDLPEEEQVAPVPFAVGFSTEAIINWRTETTAEGQELLTMLVLEEPYEDVDDRDEYVSEEKTQWRVLRLISSMDALQRLAEADTGPDLTFDGSEDAPDPIDQLTRNFMGFNRFVETPNLVYVVEIYRKQEQDRTSGKQDEFVQYSFSMPKVRGRPLETIPFFFFNTKDTSPNTLPMPPMEAIVSANLSHYRNSADLEHGQHFTALPTPWAAGFDIAQGEVLKIGSTNAWVTSDPQASAGYLEFTGAGLGRLAESMKDKETLMAILGARMLEEPKNAVEAAETHRTRKSGESATIADLAGVISQSLEKMLRVVATWVAGETSADDVVYEINKDYEIRTLDPQVMNSLVLLLQAGKMSYEVFFWNLQRGEMLPDGHTLEDELDAIENGPQPAVIEVESDDLDLDDDDDDEKEDDDEEEKTP